MVALHPLCLLHWSGDLVILVAKPLNMSSVRELARSLGLSHTTVSDALRKNPRVRKETRQRVLIAAEKAGYRYNPLAGALMSQMRRKGVTAFQGVLAVVDFVSMEERTGVDVRFNNQLLEGAKDKANQLGFKTEVFVIPKEKLSVSRLDRILNSRGINGLLVLPAWGSPEIALLNWDHYTGVYTDYISEEPALDLVCPDYFGSMMLAMSRIRQYGYRRPGFVVDGKLDRRLLYRWEGAFRMFNLHIDGFDAVEPLIADHLNEAAFKNWFEKNRPDVVLCHRHQVKHWMDSMGLKIPDTHGFCSLNVTLSTEPVSGLDLRARKIGQRAVEHLIAKLRRNDYGIPETKVITGVPARWIDGPTMRKMSM